MYPRDLIYQYLADEYPHPLKHLHVDDTSITTSSTTPQNHSAQDTASATSHNTLQDHTAQNISSSITTTQSIQQSSVSSPQQQKEHLMSSQNEQASQFSSHSPTEKRGIPNDPALLSLYRECLENLNYPLAETAKNMVFGDGDPNAQIMLIGEAPGADEDEQGLPFVGRAGRYMIDVFEKYGVQRNQLYIANILKHRPPNNRDPQPAEIALCTPYLVKQIHIVQPKLLVTAGNFASKFILQTETGITKLRGNLHQSSYGTVFPILHPSAIIRGAYPKDLFESDIAKIIELASTL